MESKSATGWHLEHNILSKLLEKRAEVFTSVISVMNVYFSKIIRSDSFKDKRVTVCTSDLEIL